MMLEVKQHLKKNIYLIFPMQSLIDVCFTITKKKHNPFMAENVSL